MLEWGCYPYDALWVIWIDPTWEWTCIFTQLFLLLLLQLLQLHSLHWFGCRFIQIQLWSPHSPVPHYAGGLVNCKPMMMILIMLRMMMATCSSFSYTVFKVNEYKVEVVSIGFHKIKLPWSKVLGFQMHILININISITYHWILLYSISLKCC